MRVRWPKDARILPGGLFLACPGHLGLRQELVALSHSHAGSLTTDEYGNQWLLFELNAHHRAVEFSYAATIATSPHLFDHSAFSDVIAPCHPRFLQGERGIEVDHPTVAALARKISARTPLGIMQQAFDLVRATLRYRLQKQEYGALYAASHGQGDCTEYASLFAALLRHHRIGARITIGYMPDGVLHAIAEAYLDGIWVPVDATNAPEFMLGLSYDFVVMMRANWMSADRIEKLISFHYGVAAGCRNRPVISLTARLTPQPAGKVVVLGEELAPSPAVRTLPHQSQITAAATWLQCRVDWLAEGARLYLRHDYSHEVAGNLALGAGHTLLRLYPCRLPGMTETICLVPLGDCRQLWREWQELRLVFIDSAEQSYELAVLPKPKGVLWAR